MLFRSKSYIDSYGEDKLIIHNFTKNYLAYLFSTLQYELFTQSILYMECSGKKTLSKNVLLYSYKTYLHNFHNQIQLHLEQYIDEQKKYSLQKKQSNVSTDPVTTEQVSIDNDVEEQVAVEQVATEQVAVEQVATEQVAVEQVAVEQVAAEQVTAEQDNTKEQEETTGENMKVSKEKRKNKRVNKR